MRKLRSSFCWHIDVQRMTSKHGKGIKPHRHSVRLIESSLLVSLQTVLSVHDAVDYQG